MHDSRSAVRVQGQEVKASKVKVTLCYVCKKNRKVINNLASNCWISLKFRTDFDHVTVDVPQAFKVNGSKVKITARYNVSPAKNAIIQARISCGRSNSVKIIPELSATRNTCSRS